MSKSINDIQDDDFRVIGAATGNKAENPRSNRRPLWIYAVVAVVVCAAVAIILWTKKDNTPAVAHFERSDTCAVPACAVVAEARVAIILVDELLSKIDALGHIDEDLINKIESENLKQLNLMAINGISAYHLLFSIQKDLL